MTVGPMRTLLGTVVLALLAACSTTMNARPTPSDSCAIRRLLREPGSVRASSADRQRLGLPLPRDFRTVCDQLGIVHRFTRPLSTANQWQGRALYPVRASRVGLWFDLPALETPSSRTRLSSCKPAHAMVRLTSWTPVEEAITRHGKPETSTRTEAANLSTAPSRPCCTAVTSALSKDSKVGRHYNASIERVWRAIKV